MLTDSYGRIATDLRVSLTDRCNLRCSYCMPPEGLDWLPAPEVLTGEEVVRLVRIGVEALGIREVRFTGGEPLLRRDLVSIIAATAVALAAPGDLADHQRDRPRPARRRAARRGPGPDQRLARHAPPRGLQEADPPRPARRRAVRPRGRRGGGAHARQGQRGADARPERGRGARPAALLHGARVRAAVHRADAARRAARLEARGDDHRGRDLRLAVPCVRAFRGFRTGAWRCPRRDVPRRRRAGPRRGDRVRHPPVLRRVRPGPAHGRRADPQLPVRPVGERPALRCCGRGPADEEIAARWRAAVASKLPGHGINDPTFLQPDRPMSAIGG